MEPQVVVGAAFVGVEDEPISADGQRDCEPAEDVEGGLGAGVFIAAELGDVDADAFGEGLLGEASRRSPRLSPVRSDANPASSTKAL